MAGRAGPLGTDEHKPFLEVAPYLIAVFALSYGVLSDGRKMKNYYVQESVPSADRGPPSRKLIQAVDDKVGRDADLFLRRADAVAPRQMGMALMPAVASPEPRAA